MVNHPFVGVAEHTGPRFGCCQIGLAGVAKQFIIASIRNNKEDAREPDKMGKPLITLCAAALYLATSAVPVFAGSINSYQVTGPVLELTNDMVAVRKGKDRWELGRDSSTKVDGDLKVGSKVTIQYRMVATTIEVKPDKAPKKSK